MRKNKLLLASINNKHDNICQSENSYTSYKAQFK